MTTTTDNAGAASRNQTDEVITELQSRPNRQRNATRPIRARWAASVTVGLGLLLLVAAALESGAVLHSFEASDVAARGAATALENQRLLLAAVQSASPTGPRAAPENAGTPDPAAQRARLAAAVERDAAMQPTLEKHRIVWESRSYALLLVTGNLAALTVFCASALSIIYMLGQAENRRDIETARRSVLGAERKRANFLAAAGHDLRQPLQALDLFLGTLLQRPLDPESRALGHRIEMTADAMRRMIDGLLDVAKLDAGLVAADMRDLPLDTLLGSFHGEFSRLADDAGITLHFEPTAAIVHTDPALLESVLRNLLSNAIKYTRRGSVRLSAVQHPGTVLIEIADTGIGIPAHMLDAVFQDFCRGESLGVDGLGLGLGIVRRLATLMQITVTVRSVTGTGSVFSVALPAGTARPAPPERAPPTVTVDTPRLRAVLVEDNRLVRESLAGQLDCWDLDVLQAGSGSQARALVQASGRQAFDIVIVDLHLGDMTGLALLHELDRERGHEPSAIIITGSDDRAELDRLNASPYAWLRKPIDLAALEREVRRLAARARECKQLATLIGCL